ALAVHADAAQRDGGAAAARGRIFCAHPPVEIALQGFHDHHASAIAGAADADGQRDFRSRAASVFRQLEAGCAGAITGSASLEFRIEVNPARSAGAYAERALAKGVGGSGSSARQIWRSVD